MITGPHTDPQKIEIPEDGLHLAMWMLYQTHQALYFIMQPDGSLQVNQNGKDRPICVLSIEKKKTK